MGNIIVHGFVTNKLVTQGYHSGEAPVGGDSARYYYMRKPQRKDKKPLLLTVQKLLEALKGE